MNGEKEVLQIRGLTVLFASPLGLVSALEQVDLEIQAGEKVAVLGSSGSGKTTLVRALLGLLHGKPGIIHGEIRLFGREVLAGLASCCQIREDGTHRRRIVKDHGRWQRHTRRNFPTALRQRVSGVFQDSQSSLEPWRRVRDQLPAGKEEARTWLHRFNLTPPARFLDAFPHELSAGEAARIALARGLMAPHDLFVADEPTSFLDAYTESVILDVLEEIFRAPGRTLLLITHNTEAARRLCRRGIILREGRSEPSTWTQGDDVESLWRLEPRP